MPVMLTFALFHFGNPYAGIVQAYITMFEACACKSGPVCHMESVLGHVCLGRHDSRPRTTCCIGLHTQTRQDPKCRLQKPAPLLLNRLGRTLRSDLRSQMVNTRFCP